MTDDQSVKRRIRAAMVLADLTIPELAERIETPGLGARTVRKLQDENNTERAPRRHELRIIAEACDVPAWFLERGFEGAAVDGADATVHDRVEALEREIGELRDLRAKLDQVDEDLRAVLRMASQWPTAAPPGAQPPAPQASRSTGTTPERSGRQEEEASEPGTGR